MCGVAHALHTKGASCLGMGGLLYELGNLQGGKCPAMPAGLCSIPSTCAGRGRGGRGRGRRGFQRGAVSPQDPTEAPLPPRNSRSRSKNPPGTLRPTSAASDQLPDGMELRKRTGLQQFVEVGLCSWHHHAGCIPRLLPGKGRSMHTKDDRSSSAGESLFMQCLSCRQYGTP